jgi:hypothetical protein
MSAEGNNFIFKWKKYINSLHMVSDDRQADILTAK